MYHRFEVDNSWFLPEYGYGFVIIYRLDKITFYVRKLSFSTMDWVGW